VNENKRSHRCGELRDSDIGKDVTLMGWVHTQRNLGGCIFIDLRDRDGVTQIVFDPDIAGAALGLAAEVRGEWVVGIKGKVRSRGKNANTRISTGAIEVAATELEILARAKPVPFPIENEVNASEETRLKYRFLDLRREKLQKNFILRHKFNQVVRRTLDANGFLEVETPFLIKSTPEGARDYVVPSRVHQGKFFALPQSPQLFKQLLMVAGYDRYFQITRCFRDEDLRAERQPEFTQVDLEMSFVSPEDVQNVVEGVLANIWKELLDVTLPTPFERISYDDSMNRFGVDAPDMRFGLELKDLSSVVKGCGFKVFVDTVANGGVVKAVNLSGSGEWSRKDLEELEEVVKPYGAKGLAWLKIKEDQTLQGPIAKFFTPDDQANLKQALSLKVGDTAVFVADRLKVANAALGNLRKHVAKKRALVAKDQFRFVWVVDFPLFDYDEEAKRYSAAHHPFTSPKPEHADKMLSDPASVKAQAYDIVLNGIEIGGGSIRIHDQALQSRMFEAIGIGDVEAHAKFGYLLDAFQFGAPPHGGLALGVDRIMMLICGTDSIRDVIAFPKTQKQTDLMLEAPAAIDDAQLTELAIKLIEAKKA